MSKKLVISVLSILVLALTACGQKPATPFSVESLNGRTLTLVSYLKDAGEKQLSLTIRLGTRTEIVKVDYFNYIPVEEVNGIHVVGKELSGYGIDLPYVYWPNDFVYAKSGQFPGSFTGNAYVRIGTDNFVTLFVTQEYKLTAADKKIGSLAAEYQKRRAAKANLIGAQAAKDGQTVSESTTHQGETEVRLNGEYYKDDNPYGLVPGSQCENMGLSFWEWGTDNDLADWYAACGSIAFGSFNGIPPYSEHHFPLSLDFVYDEYGTYQDLLSFAFAQLPDSYDTKYARPLCEGQSLKVWDEKLTVTKVGPWLSLGSFLFDVGYVIGGEVYVPANGWLVIELPEASYTVYHLCSK